VIVAAMGQAAFTQAVEVARPGGRIMSFAATSTGETAEVDLGVLTTSEKDILTSYSSSIELQDRAAQLVFGREIRVRELISHRMPMARAREAFALAMRPASGTLKVVLEMTGSGAR
jgi:threonine dehydrogenase-like Zn-dependent dehydrogenase